MKIVGLNSNLEDNNTICMGGSVSLIIDGLLVMAVAEDRISRNKYEGGYKAALNYILQKNNLELKDIDYICISFYGNTALPKDEILMHHIRDLGLEDEPGKLIVIPSHHLSHAYAGYFLSEFDEALIIVSDNEGSIIYRNLDEESGVVGAFCERNSYYYAKGNVITLLERDFESPKQVGFGKAYNKFTEYLGFGDYHNAGKTMGLSSYGKIPTQLENIDIWGLDENGKLISYLQESFDSVRDVNAFMDKYEVYVKERDDKIDYNSKCYKDISYYIQDQLNKWCTKKIELLIERTGVKNICLSGGVAQNGVLNSIIENKLNVKVFVPPFPSDQGQSLGNAIYAYINNNNLNVNSHIDKYTFSNYAYLGSEYTSEEIYELYKKFNTCDKYKIYFSNNVAKEAAELISKGNIIGWMQGKSEYGCRALGNRSILADPRYEEIRDKVNILKRRELFRPLAPSVLSEKADEYFYNINSLLTPYMLGVVMAKEDNKSKIAGAVHVDGTSRIQIVEKFQNERYYELLTWFYKITEVPMVINTSFNIAGDPIVENPYDAFFSFEKMQLDVLICGDVVVKR